MHTLEDHCKFHTKRATTIQLGNGSPEHLPQRNENLRFHKNLCMNFYSILICNSQKLEATQMSFIG